MAPETLATRLKAFRESKGLTKYRLAKLSGISQTYIYRLELGEIKNPRRDTLQALAKGLNITLAQLVGETAPAEIWELVEQSLKAYIPVYAGIYEVGMEPIDRIVCTQAEIPPDTLRAYRIAGLCLEPEIHEGDTLIVDTALTPRVGDLVIVIIQGQPLVERYGANGERPPNKVVSIHGVITEYVRKLR